MKFKTIIYAMICLFLSCTKEPTPCNVSSYIGTWKVKHNIICDIDSTNEFVIEQGPWPSQIQMKYGTDILVFTVSDCKASHESTDLGWTRNANMTLKDDEISFNHKRWVLLFFQTCSMTLTRK